jgi:hypothetical protein
LARKFSLKTLGGIFSHKLLVKKKRSGSDIMSEKSGFTIGKRQRKFIDADEDSFQTLRQTLMKAEKDAET